MTKIISERDDPTTPRIQRDEVASFFEERARRISRLGPVRAVLYQDDHLDLAERRDSEEKRVLTPLLEVRPSTRFLDIGCGTGRWVSEVAGVCAHYHGIDFSPGLVEFARSSHSDRRNCRFTVCSATDLTLAALLEKQPFDRILCAGLFIYLNDDEVEVAMRRIAEVAAASCRVVLREPLALTSRLTILDHYSEELRQSYNAIYRTQDELLGLAQASLMRSGFRLSGAADVFADPTLNNRSETRQRWMVLERLA